MLRVSVIGIVDLVVYPLGFVRCFTCSSVFTQSVSCFILFFFLVAFLVFPNWDSCFCICRAHIRILLMMLISFAHKHILHNSFYFRELYQNIKFLLSCHFWNENHKIHHFSIDFLSHVIFNPQIFHISLKSSVNWKKRKKA